MSDPVSTWYEGKGPKLNDREVVMTNKQMPEEGQTVEVVLRGPVDVISDLKFWIGGNLVRSDSDHVVSVTVITPPLVVGDTVIVAERDAELPVGTVVRYGPPIPSRARRFKTEAGWMADDGSWISTRHMTDAYTVELLPERGEQP